LAEVLFITAAQQAGVLGSRVDSASAAVRQLSIRRFAPVYGSPTIEAQP
jgi:hypothetical protein